MRIGIDAGGTFTDFAITGDTGAIQTFKLPSDPRAPARVILEGISRAVANRRAEIIHGSTVATNALLERKGAKTALVTTAGFEDVIHIGRQNRAELYNLMPRPRRGLIERSDCFGVAERAYFDGTVALRPTPDELKRLRRRLERAGYESVAICFLHAYQTSENERAVSRALAGLGFLTSSHEICPEYREYERTSTTVINAYVGPLMDRYLAELEAGARRPVAIMQSNGGFLPASVARRQPVRTVLSGPAGGVIGAARMARLAGFRRALGFDMGGTSTDVSLCDVHPHEAAEASIDGFPIRVSMLDIHTVGAGGGSIARVDEGGLLRVGPESAGADPGPACYGRAELATVTDAHVVLGRIAADQLVGGEMHLQVERARTAVDRIAARLGIAPHAAAAGIVRVANAGMERAIRVVSVERGYDPREFALVAFGGCGGLHACEMSAELGIRTVLVPAQAGALSALGMLLADNVRDYTAAVLNRNDVENEFRVLERRARRENREARLTRSADIRYAGQSYELNVPWRPDNPAKPFHAAHQRAYGYFDPSRPTEVVTIRVRARRPAPRLKLAYPRARVPRGREGMERRRVWVDGGWRSIEVSRREEIGLRRRSGPALILDYGSTTLIPPGWSFRLDSRGTLVVERRSVIRGA